MMTTRKEFLKYAVQDRGFTSHHVEDYISCRSRTGEHDTYRHRRAADAV